MHPKCTPHLIPFIKGRASSLPDRLVNDLSVKSSRGVRQCCTYLIRKSDITYNPIATKQNTPHIYNTAQLSVPYLLKPVLLLHLNYFFLSDNYFSAISLSIDYCVVNHLKNINERMEWLENYNKRRTCLRFTFITRGWDGVGVQLPSHIW